MSDKSWFHGEKENNCVRYVRNLFAAGLRQIMKSFRDKRAGEIEHTRVLSI